MLQSEVVSEADLPNRLRQGDKRAFELIFKANYEALCRFAFSFLGDREESEEMVQQMFAGIWEKRQNLDIKSGLKSYLFGSIRNACLNRIEHGKVKLKYQEYQLNQAPITTRPNLVSETLQAKELERLIYKSVEALPTQCRTVFGLSRFAGLTYQEIADKLEISVKTVENHMGKALKELRINLADYLTILSFTLIIFY